MELGNDGRARPLIGRLPDLLLLLVFAALPVVGLIAGPAYSGMIFGLGGIRLLHLLWTRPRAVKVDRRLIGLAVAFAALSLATCAWSIVPRHSLAGARQTAAILAGALAFLGSVDHVADDIYDRLTQAMTVAFVIGAIMILADAAAGFHLMHWLGMRDLSTKYNRGILYSLLLFWPLLADRLARRQRIGAAAMGVAMIVTVAVGKATTAKLVLVAAAVTVVVARWAPVSIGWVLALGTMAIASALPFALRLIEPFRAGLSPYLKHSALHRLEIWDYMSARVMERPLLGWGTWSSEFLPITRDELHSYIYADGVGIYPHNQWLQIWVENGLAGVVIAAGLVLLTLSGIAKLSPATRPYAYGSFVTAMMTACADFQLSTDSWWAALAATAFLFHALSRRNVACG